MNAERTQNGYYWVKPKTGYYKDKWVIATYEGKMFWVHGIGVAYTEGSLEINNNEILRAAESEKRMLTDNELSQQRERLINFLTWYNSENDSCLPDGIEGRVDEYLKLISESEECELKSTSYCGCCMMDTCQYHANYNG